MTTTPKIRVVLSTPDRMRFVCWLLGHTWRLEFAQPGQYVCVRCQAIGRVE